MNIFLEANFQFESLSINLKLSFFQKVFESNSFAPSANPSSFLQHRDLLRYISPFVEKIISSLTENLLKDSEFSFIGDVR